MPRTLAVCAVLSLLAGAPLLRSQDDESVQPFSPEELDNLLAPIALYPDPLLAQVLLAATFPDQIDEAARFSRAGANPDAIDTQPWDVSVKAVAHYPDVLDMLADRLDWTTAVGQANVNQSEDVMASIQRLRQDARVVGNLETTPEQEVTVDNGDIEIEPAQPEYCYVPEYDPGVVFFGSGGVYGGAVITFSRPYPIGVWLNHSFDWRRHRIYYHGWSEGRGWIARSRPYIHVNNIYVNNNLRNVTVNRGVATHAVNYGNLARYNSVHQNVTYGNPRGNPELGRGNGNQIIERNMNVNDSRLDSYRGHASRPPEGGSRMEPQSRETERPGNQAFGANRSGFGAPAASQRGQSSRAQAPHPSPAPRPSGGGAPHGGGGGGGGGSHGGGGGGGHH